MSIRYGQKTSSIADRRPVALAHNRDTTFDGFYTPPTPWERPSDWLTITPPLSSEQKVVLLVSVYNNKSNLLAFRLTGNYTVDWGDGSPTQNVASTVIASREYDYASISSPPISDGTKQVIVTITPNGAANLTAISLAEAHPFALTVGTSNYSQYILEVYLSLPNLTSIPTGLGTSNIDGSGQVNNLYLTNVELINIGSLTTFGNLFYNAYSLRRVSITANTSGVTGTIGSMFVNCFQLTEAPFFNTRSATSMAGMFQNCHSLVSVPAYDCTNSTSISLIFQNCVALQRVSIQNTTAVTNFNSAFEGCFSLEKAPDLSFGTSSGLSITCTTMFQNCYNLKSVPVYNTIRVTSMQGMFQGCRSLTSVPLFDTRNVTTMQSMFNTCPSLKTVPLFNTSNVTNMQNMFDACNSLEMVPLFDTSRVTNFSFMFFSCWSLERAPAFNLSGLGNTPPSTSLASMFRQCYSLKEAPQFDTTRVTSFAGTFLDCRAIKTVPHYNTLSATSMTNMFEGATSLQSVPLFDTRNVTNMTFMFFNCYALTGIPAFDTTKVTNFASAFRGCRSIKTIPEFTTRINTTLNNTFSDARLLNTVSLCAAAVSDATTLFSGAESLAVARLSGIGPALTTSVNLDLTNMSKESLEETFFLLGLGTAKTIIITNSYGAKRYPTLTVNGVSTTSGSVTATTSSSVASLSTGMQITGLSANTGPPITSPISVTFTDATDTVNLTAHGLRDGDKVSFSTITTTTGISTFTIYYVINKTDNDFQIARTPGGSAIALTNNGSGTMRYNALITEIRVGTPNTIIFDRPMTITGSNHQTFRFLITEDARLRNWTVTG